MLVSLQSTVTRCHLSRNDCIALSFSVSAPILWNSLPEEIRNCHSIETFKSLLKTHLFNDAFN